MKTDELIYRNKSTIPSDYLFEVPDINIGNMDHKEATTSVASGYEMIGETETYLPSTASFICKDVESKCKEPNVDPEFDTPYKDNSMEDGCVEDFAFKAIKQDTHDNSVAAHTFLEERSTSPAETYTSLDETSTSLGDTFTSPNETASNCSEQNTSEIRMKELKEFSLMKDENDSISSHVKDAKVADHMATQKRVRLVKAYAWIKEEMEPSTAKNIASHFYRHQHKLMSLHGTERIHRTKERRDAVEVLLKRVLMGPDNIYDVFVNALREEGSEHIAEHLDKVEVTDMDIEVFSMLETSAEHKKPRPYFEEPRLAFSKRNQSTLKYWLNDKAVVDSINDQFLSRMVFRIDEHTNIADNTMDTKRKVQLLLYTMKLCSENILEDFFQILKSDDVCMSHVIGKLEQRNFGEAISRQKSKRKSTSFDDDEVTQPKIKRNTLCQAKESNIVESIQESDSNVKKKALDFGMVFDKVSKGSIIIQLTPKDSNSWRTLKTSCRTGNIKDFIPEVFKNNTSDMEEGEYMLRFIIYLLPTPPYSKADNKVMFSLEDEQSTSTYSKDLEECSNVLCQELEITDELLAILKKEKIVGENIKKDIAKQPRRKRIKYLLDHIAQHGDRGYKILKDYIKTKNEYLYKELGTREKTKRLTKSMQVGANVTARPGSATRENRKELFYTASVVLLVKKSEGEKERDKERGDVEITCPSIVSSECHFTDEESMSQHESDEEFRSLDDNWFFIAKHQENTEKVDGKRKEIEEIDLDQRDIGSVLKKNGDDESKEKEAATEPVLPALSADKPSSNRKEKAINQTGIDVKAKGSKKSK